MSSGIMEILDLIDGYATLIIKLLEDRDMDEESPQLYHSSLKIFSELWYNCGDSSSISLSSSNLIIRVA